MASSTLSPFRDASNQVTFSLASTTSDGARYIVSGRSLSAPFVVDIQRKLARNASGNDHIFLRVARTEANSTTGKLATLQARLDISIPKDQTELDPTSQKELVTIMMSLLRDNTLSAATFVNVTALIEGRDL